MNEYYVDLRLVFKGEPDEFEEEYDRILELLEGAEIKIVWAK